MPMPLSAIIAFGSLTLAIICVWAPAVKPNALLLKRLWIILCVVSIACGLFFGFIHWIALVPIIGLATACYGVAGTDVHPMAKIFAGVGVIGLSVGFFLHVVPGFSNLKIISDVKLSPDALSYSKYLNFDKGLAGLFLMAWGHEHITSLSGWQRMLAQTIPGALLVIIVVMVLSLLFGYVRVDVKIIPLFFAWAWSNLFFTCMAEEGFFRGFVQKHLVALLGKYRYGSYMGVGAASLLFGLAHYAGGGKYILLATIAGAGYGWAYYRTRRIEAGILMHFMLNSIHFLFFTYPALA
jgi:uncharacterized protein